MEALKRIQPILEYAAAHLDEDVSLTALSRQAHLSAFHLQRLFAAVAGETPKQHTLRLRLQRAAALLLTGNDSILEVALSCGFQSHEVFCRMFRRHFEMTPSAYRKRGFAGNVDATQRARHAALVGTVGPCIALYHISDETRSDKNHMTYSISKTELTPQPVLVVRRRVKRSEIAAAIGEALPHVFHYAQQHGIALAGLPFTRYVEVGPGMITLEPGMRVTAAGQEAKTIEAAWTVTSGDATVVRDILPGGLVATTTHTGPYQNLPAAYGALEEWIDAQGLAAAAAPWECYLTDPSEYPDPEDWKTDVFWPIKVS